MPGKLSPSEFYKKYYPLAVKYTKGTGIHPETLMAQMANESSWGATANPQNGFALFGIKGDGYKGKTVNLDTTEENKSTGIQYKANKTFRAYDSVDDAMQDYVKLIQNNYKDALNYSTPEEQLRAIGSMGYGSKNYGDYTANMALQNKKFIPNNNMGATDIDEIDTSKELNAQLAEYKKKAKAGTLTQQEFKDAKVLYDKAKVILDDKHTFNVFASQMTKSVFTPYIKQDARQYRKDAGADIIRLKNDLLKAKDQNAVSAINAELANARARYKSADDYMSSFNKQHNDFLNNEQGVFKKEEAQQALNSNVGGNWLSINQGPSAESSPEDRKNAVDEYNKIYNNFADKSLTDYNNFISGQGTDRAKAYFGIPDIKLEQTPLNGNGGAGSSSQSLSVSGSIPSTPVPFTINGMTMDQYKSFKPNIHDMSYTEAGTGDPFAVKTKDPNELRKQLDADTALLEQLKNQTSSQPAYGPDSQPKSDIGGYLMDIGRMGLGLKGALEDVPEYTPSRMFSTAMNESEQRRNMGLSDQEISHAKSLAERGYGYDVKNIRNLSGGSAGVALGNLGRATGQLQDSYANIAASDQAARRMNRQQFYNAANQAENVNQYKFGLDYNNAMTNKQAGAALVNDALSNIMNRRQYENSYGKGSQYYEYLKELTQGQQRDTQLLNDANERRRLESIADLQSRIDSGNEEYGKLTNSYNNLEGAGNVVNRNNGIENQNQENTYGTSVLAGNRVTPSGNTSTGYVPGTGLLAEAGVKNAVKETTPSGDQIISGSTEKPVNDPDALKVMENRGDKVYNQVMNSPEFQAKVQDIHDTYNSQIDDLKSKAQEAKTVAEMKRFEKMVKELEEKRSKDIDAATKEQEKWADSQFDENGKYIGK